MESIRPYNTFKVDHQVGEICHVLTVPDLSDALATMKDPIILGGGSNILFTRDTNRPVILIESKGISIESEDEQSVTVSVAAGEVWHDLVLWAVANDYGGLENLSLIPGKCGAAPMQNIGAYGVELSQLLLSVSCIERATGKVVVLSAAECKLDYRDSIFKGEYKDKFVITSIKLRLTKPSHHKINISYGDIKDVLLKNGISQPGIKEVSAAVIAIRSGKLPNPDYLPNAGSFFKNPVISIPEFSQLKKQFPDLPSYPVSDQSCKVPAGWLIDQCGWKGILVGQVGVHLRQALVIVNHGSRMGSDVLNLAQQIQDSVYSGFGIHLDMEVNILP